MISVEIQNAWRAFWKLRPYLASKNIQLRARRRLCDMCILPILTYGCQTWSLTNKATCRLQVTQRAMERRMLGVTRRDRMTNAEVRRRTGVKDVLQEVRHLKWKWAGHVVRKNDGRWTTRLTNWIPRDRRRFRGRQRKRWREEFPGRWAQISQGATGPYLAYFGQL